MKVGVISEDVRLCNQLAILCHDNNLKIEFIRHEDKVFKELDYVVIDIDLDQSLFIQKCKDYSKINIKVLGAISIPIQSIILESKKAGCLIVLTKNNFASNLIDIINRAK